MRGIVWRGLVTAATVLSIGWLARAPYSPPGNGVAVLRLSWRMMPNRTEHCRQRSDEELEKLPAHMRSRTICRREEARYRLVVQIDDQTADTTRLAAQNDAPIFVWSEQRLVPGLHRVRVSFARESAASRRDRDEQHERDEEHERDDEREREHRDQHALDIDTRVTAQTGMVELITLDPVARRLVLVRSADRLH